jgi:hypothetical protein
VQSPKPIHSLSASLNHSVSSANITIQNHKPVAFTIIQIHHQFFILSASYQLQHLSSSSILQSQPTQPNHLTFLQTPSITLTHLTKTAATTVPNHRNQNPKQPANGKITIIRASHIHAAPEMSPPSLLSTSPPAHNAGHHINQSRSIPTASLSLLLPPSTAQPAIDAARFP